LYIKGLSENLWCTDIDKLYFLGTLYLRMKNYNQAKKCFEAALYQNFNDFLSLFGLAFIYSKSKDEDKYNDIVDHIKIVYPEIKDFSKHFKDLDDPIIDPNPFQPCDLNCKEKNNPELCNQCFFNNVSEQIFMKKITDEFR